MAQSTFPPPSGVQQPYGQQPYGQPGSGGPGARYGQPGPGSRYQRQPKRKTGLIVGSLVAALIVIGGLVVGAIFLFGTKTIDQAGAQREVTQLGQQLLGGAPEGVSCPADVEDDISSQVEAAVSDQVVDADTSCDAGGRTVLVDPDGEQLNCTVSDADDPSQSIGILASVARDGSVTIESVDQG